MAQLLSYESTRARIFLNGPLFCHWSNTIWEGTFYSTSHNFLAIHTLYETQKQCCSPTLHNLVLEDRNCQHWNFDEYVSYNIVHNCSYMENVQIDALNAEKRGKKGVCNEHQFFFWMLYLMHKVLYFLCPLHLITKGQGVHSGKTKQYVILGIML